MAQIVYRNASGEQIVVKNPTAADNAEMARVVAGNIMRLSRQAETSARQPYDIDLKANVGSR